MYQKNFPANTPFYILAISIFTLLKFWYNSASVDELSFILAPTSKILAFITNSETTFISGKGYLHYHTNIMLVKSCSGFQFGILCFAMLNWLLLSYTKSTAEKTCSIAVSLIIAYFVTIFTNASRILLALFSQKGAEIFISDQPHSFIHEVIGTITYITSLVLIYITVEYLLKNYKQPAHEKLA